MESAARILAILWTGGLAAVPLALIVAAICRCKGVRPATRHVLWAAVLASFVAPLVSTWTWRPEWSRSERVIAAAERVIRHFEAETQDIVIREPRRASEAASPKQLSNRAEPAAVLSGETGDCQGAGVNSTGIGPVWAVTPWPRPPRVADDCPRTDWATPLDTNEQLGDPYSPGEAKARGPMAGPSVENQHAAMDAGAGSAAPLAEARESRPTANTALPLPLARIETVPAVDPDPAAQTNPVASKDNAAGSWGAVRTWLAKALEVRDAVASLPPLSAAVWLWGALLLLTLRLARALAGASVLRRARPAGATIQSLVHEAARDLGLGYEPEAVVVDLPVSPMVWCGMRPRLVLPTALWRSLDHESRRAVVVHELAHLRRRDHILYWLEAVIGAVYWWHPVAWWARRKLRDEAEACCDAWVTSLLPGSRRAYALALVAAKSYLSHGQGRGNVPGAEPWLGVMSGSAKRLARRITMVMTQRTTPRMSVIGGCVAAMVVVAGMLVAPALGCPPEEKAKDKNKQALIIKRGAKDPAAADQPSVQFLGEAPALEAMQGGHGDGAAAVPQPPAPPEPGQPAAPPAPPRSPKPALGPAAPMPPKARSPAGVYVMPRTAQPVLSTESLKEGRTPRAYTVSPGKLDALYGLMSRSDVPVLVEKQSDRVILVYATDEQHPVFAAFVKLIDPESKVDAKVKAAAKLKASGQKAELLAYAKAMKDLELSRAQTERNADRAREEAERVREQSREVQELARQLRQSAKDTREDHAKKTLDQAAADLRARSETLNSQSRETDDRLRQLQRQLQELERRASQIERKMSGGGGGGGREDIEEDANEDIDEPEANETESEGFVPAEPWEILVPSTPTVPMGLAPAAPVPPIPATTVTVPAPMAPTLIAVPAPAPAPMPAPSAPVPAPAPPPTPAPR